ncbi:hypothetical protein AVEN_106676-1 [Araneus ventricosus]|uniref:Uncharacterized protein n=1 Tax=Araneus ventricosus TaxID=182803 RepID=A0A4Y2P1Z0_ARAVE|nr:hypothetical protein AVEN_106676-1 [Araneus ventricosus]
MLANSFQSHGRKQAVTVLRKKPAMITEQMFLCFDKQGYSSINNEVIVYKIALCKIVTVDYKRRLRDRFCYTPVCLTRDVVGSVPNQLSGERYEKKISEGNGVTMPNEPDGNSDPDEQREMSPPLAANPAPIQVSKEIPDLTPFFRRAVAAYEKPRPISYATYVNRLEMPSGTWESGET